VTREALAVGLWRTRLALTRNRCLYVAESSLAAAERLQRIRRACQQKDARIYRRTADARWASMAFSVRRMASPSGARVLKRSQTLSASRRQRAFRGGANSAKISSGIDEPSLTASSDRAAVVTVLLYAALS
jgi:hypothetical protein